ncbi:hypothetical protein E0H45_01600 [Kribbella soli]|uniref:Uncharacterized protein n=1 Tax=Kribbella soli TaxID=1124743 RepID=A0A4R0HFS3_9ACTN|nr:hypothetical protein E0H45_01600 [Kribbella soli]
MPVRACPIRSVPIRATGRVISWIGKGSMMLTRSSASQISGSTPSSRKVVRLIASHMLVRTDASVAGRLGHESPDREARGHCASTSHQLAHLGASPANRSPV